MNILFLAAQGAAKGGQSSFLIMMVVIFVIMWFFMIRPQKKRQEEQQKMLDSLQPGDAIQTIGGLHGIVDEVDRVNGRVVLDCEGIYLTFERRAVATITKKAGEVPTVPEEDLGTNEPDVTDEN